MSNSPTIITRNEAREKGILHNVDQIVWYGRSQWCHAGRYRFPLS